MARQVTVVQSGGKLPDYAVVSRSVGGSEHPLTQFQLEFDSSKGIG